MQFKIKQIDNEFVCLSLEEEPQRSKMIENIVF